MSTATNRLSALGAVLAVNLAARSPGQEAEALPLPRWGDGAGSGASGLGEGFNNLLPPPPELREFVESGPRIEEALPENRDIGPQDLSLFLRGSAPPRGQQTLARHQPTAAAALRYVPGDILEQAYQAGPRDYLIDPQGLVPEVLRDDLQRLLEFHGGDARVKLFLLVLDADQKLPERTVLDRIAQSALTRQDACLAVYPLGEPWRARFMVSKAVHQAVPVQSLTQLAEDCTQDALKVNDGGQQLQRFAIRLSTRLFWLEKSLPAPAAHAPAPLQEVAQSTVANAGGATAESRWTPVFAWAVIFSLAGSGGWFFWRGRKSRRRGLSHVWMLPEVDTVPRLGGNFSGGTGAVVHYGHQANRG